MESNISEAGVTGAIGNSFVLLGKVILLVSYLVYWKSRLLTSKKDALVMDTSSRFIAVLAFILQFSRAGVVYSIFCIIRNFRAERIRGWPKDLKQKEFLVLLVIFLAAFFLITAPGADNLELLLFVAVYEAVSLYGTVVAIGMKGILKYNIAGSLLHFCFLFYYCSVKSELNVRDVLLEVITLIVYFIGLSKNKESYEDI